MCMNGVRSVGAFLWKAELAPKKPLLLGTKSKPVLIKPTGSKKVKVVLDYPVKKEIPKSEAMFLEKYGLKKYKFINAGNQHLVVETKKVFSYDLDALSSKLRKRRMKFSLRREVNVRIGKGLTSNATKKEVKKRIGSLLF